MGITGAPTAGGAELSRWKRSLIGCRRVWLEGLADLAGAQARLPKGADPWGAPIDIPMTRERPDSIVINGTLHPITVKTPAKVKPDKKYPLVVELGTADHDEAFVVKPSRTTAATKEFDAVIVEMMSARYPIDPAAVR